MAKKDVVATEVQTNAATEVNTGTPIPVEVEAPVAETTQEQPAVNNEATPAPEAPVEVIKEKKHPIKDAWTWLGNHVPKPVKTVAKIAAAGGVIFGAVKLGEHIGKGEGFDEAYSTFVENFGNGNTETEDTNEEESEAEAEEETEEV